jgi:hypothetical protein
MINTCSRNFEKKKKILCVLNPHDQFISDELRGQTLWKQVYVIESLSRELKDEILYVYFSLCIVFFALKTHAYVMLCLFHLHTNKSMSVTVLSRLLVSLFCSINACENCKFYQSARIHTITEAHILPHLLQKTDHASNSCRRLWPASVHIISSGTKPQGRAHLA